MTRPHDLAADLPPPNADEPASLRQDIVDELADHLACAARQEALRAELDRDGEDPDEQTIADRVLARFGDPRRIARRLWFDAMKGRLMMQKLTAAFAAVAAVGAIAGCVLLWTALDATRASLADAIEENRKLRQTAAKAAEEAVRKERLGWFAAEERSFRRSQKHFRELEAKWIADVKKHSFKTSERTPLKFKLVLETLDGEPAVGYSVGLQGTFSDSADGVKRSNESGFVDFGSVEPGPYKVTVTSPGNVNREFPVVIGMGTETERTIICQ